MSTKTSVGNSKARNSYEAGKLAVKDALKKLGGKKADLAMVFASVNYEQDQLLKGVASEIPGIPISGCSGEGVISSAGSDETPYSVSVMLFSSDKVQFESFRVLGLKEDSAGCGRQLAEMVNNSKQFDKASTLFLFPDGLTVNCSQLLKNLEGNLKKPLLILGGTAGDMMGHLYATFQYHNGEVTSDSATAILFSGEMHIDFEVNHGCDPLGLDLVVTKAEANQIQEIDGRNAWSVFKEYLDGDPEELIGEDVVHLCIGERLPKEQVSVYSEYIIRTPLAFEKATGYITTGAEIKAGTKIRMSRRDPDRIASSTLSAAKAISARNVGNEPFAIVQFDCAGRGSLLFGQRTNETVIHPIQKELGHKENWIGFHTYGEIAPISGKSHFHNFTVVLCGLYEKKSS